jgi:formate dehydrogenase subunit gamma
MTVGKFMPDHEPWDLGRAREIIADLAALEGATLPMLHALQRAFGHVPDEAVPLVAEALNMSRAEVHGCLTFYHDFHRQPPGRHVLKLCRAEACQAVGADQLHAQVLAELGVAWHGTTADGQVTAEPVFCLGLCACGPAALLDDTPLARLDADAVRAALAEAA